MKRPYYAMTARMIPDWKVQKGGHLWEGNTLSSNLGPRVADVTAWIDPPHVYLANLAYDPASRGGLAAKDDVLLFTKKYGVLEPMDGAPFFLELEVFQNIQKQLRVAWQKQDHHLIFERPWRTAEKNYEHAFHVKWEVKRGRLQMRLTSCYDYLSILLTRDIIEKHAKVCRNPKCFSPYFVAQRTDAKYCTHACASDTSVKNFRQRRKAQKRRR